MNPSHERARILLRTAKDDQYVFERLAADPNAPEWSTGFHAQQAVEKALKSVLSWHGVECPRTHNLVMLVELVRKEGHAAPAQADRFAPLTPYGVAVRYDDVDAEAEITVNREWIAPCVADAIAWAESVVARKEPS